MFDLDSPEPQQPEGLYHVSSRLTCTTTAMKVSVPTSYKAGPYLTWDEMRSTIHHTSTTAASTGARYLRNVMIIITFINTLIMIMIIAIITIVIIIIVIIIIIIIVILMMNVSISIIIGNRTEIHLNRLSLLVHFTIISSTNNTHKIYHHLHLCYAHQTTKKKKVKNQKLKS